MSIIVAKLSGGLGNQMFQYALARHMALDNKARLMVHYFNHKNDTPRHYSLKHFQIKATHASVWHMIWVAPWPKSLLTRVSWIPSWLSGGRYVAETSFAFDPNILKMKSPLYLDGHWQSEKYFAEVASQIRDDFKLAQPISEVRQKILNQIRSTLAISLHIRRGDYVSNPQTAAFHGICGVDWYLNAMDLIASDVADPTFFVFSDDPQWAKENLITNHKVEFIAPNPDQRDFEDMHLMSMCKHHIIANSTFSWWGAWLNPDPNKKVIAPARWFATDIHDTRDLLPENWIRL